MAMGMAREESESQPSCPNLSDASYDGSFGGDPNLDQPWIDEQGRLDHDVVGGLQIHQLSVTDN